MCLIYFVLCKGHTLHLGPVRAHTVVVVVPAQVQGLFHVLVRGLLYLIVTAIVQFLGQDLAADK